MESNVMFSGISSGILSLEMPLHPQNPQNSMQFHHSQMVSYANNPTDQHHAQTIKQQSYPCVPKHKQLSPLSDEDDPGSATGSGFNPDDNSNSVGNDGKRKFSQWQRMKWTDTMVRLLIMAVFYIGDEAGSEPVDPSKKKTGGGVLQKKGKWKSVSRAMMEKGFYVSPQQCEDKFNDLNKRYKRVNDILGKGTACRVVENQSLLETMDLSPKMKEEVKKLLNSKHLFFREMCAYHNSCGHLTNNTGPSDQTHQPNQQKQEQPNCFHLSATNTQNVLKSSRTEGESSKMERTIESEDDDEGDDDESEDDSENKDGEEDGEAVSLGQNGHDVHQDEPSCKRPRKTVLRAPICPLVNQLSTEATNVIQDSTKSTWERKQWIKTRLMRLEEQRVGYQSEALELEKQRLKWIRFSSKKEREMERARLENERKRLENERMVLLFRQKEIELLEFHHHQQHSYTKRSDPSSITG